MDLLGSGGAVILANSSNRLNTGVWGYFVFPFIFPFDSSAVSGIMK